MHFVSHRAQVSLAVPAAAADAQIRPHYGRLNITPCRPPDLALSGLTEWHGRKPGNLAGTAGFRHALDSTRAHLLNIRTA